MFLSDMDARGKYCPFLATPDGHFRVCQATKCMMWRFAEPSGTGKGYCGLAGRPAAAPADKPE